MAHDAGLPGPRLGRRDPPRNQGANLTAWELGHHGVPHTVIVDNAGGHLMQHGRVDPVPSPAPTARRAPAMSATRSALSEGPGRPMTTACRSTSPCRARRSTGACGDGIAEIPIEERDGGELLDITGRAPDGRVASVRIAPEGCPVANFRVRRDPGAPGHRPDHRARHLPGLGRGAWPRSTPSAPRHEASAPAPADHRDRAADEPPGPQPRAPRAT